MTSRQQEGLDPGQDARRRHRQAARERQEPVAQDGGARQPGQPVLPDPVLGPGAGQPERGSGARRSFRSAGHDAGRAGTDHRRGTQQGAGRCRRHRWLLLPGPGEDHRGDAAEQDVQRRAGVAAELTSASAIPPDSPRRLIAISPRSGKPPCGLSNIRHRRADKGPTPAVV